MDEEKKYIHNIFSPASFFVLRQQKCILLTPNFLYQNIDPDHTSYHQKHAQGHSHKHAQCIRKNDHNNIRDRCVCGRSVFAGLFRGVNW